VFPGANSAQRRYAGRFIPLMIVYALLTIASSWIAKHYAPPEGPLAWLLALLPTLPILGVIWTMGRLLVETTDEYLRLLIVRQMLVATGFLLSVTSVWGFLELFGHVPPLPIFYCFPIWCGGLLLGSLYNWTRL